MERVLKILKQIISSKDNLFRITVLLVVLFFLSNVVLLFLFVKEKERTKNLLSVLEKNGILTLADVELDKELKKIRLSQGSTQGEKEVSPELVLASGTVPSPFILAGEGEYLLLCEKKAKRLSLFRFTGGKFSLVKTYRCIVGANHQNKQKPGDRATPEGVFFFIRFIPEKELPKTYGYGAFVLNYPNFLAKKEGKKGDGIWLHGHSADKNIGKDLLNTKGCIVIDNSSLQELSTYVKPNGTPIVIVDKVEAISQKNQDELSGELKTFLNSWREAWESIDTKRYLSFYAPDFISSDGMSYSAFKQHKERVNSTKKVIKVNIENTAIFMPQEYKGEIAVVRFRQKYHSNNFNSESKKIFYLKKENTRWFIIGESTFF